MLVLNRNFPRGIDLAAEVLRYLDTEEIRIQAWTQRKQDRALLATDQDAAYVGH